MKYEIRDSKIHGKGLFLNEDVEPGVVIDRDVVGDLYKRWKKFGIWVNHGSSPNVMLTGEEYDWYHVSIRPIKKGEELTLNYRELPEKFKTLKRNIPRLDWKE